jgi:hypothetical protein
MVVKKKKEIHKLEMLENWRSPRMTKINGE